MSKLFLILHDEQSNVGTTEEWCRSRGIPYEIVYANQFLKNKPSLAESRGVIVFGGDMQVWDTKPYPWLSEEKKLIRDAIKKEIPIFGLCLGAQLLAEQLGAEVKTMNTWEIGWYEVEISGESRKLTPLHWHSSTFDLPEGSELLATNSFCKNQAFRFSERYVGCQFHCEINEARLAHALEGWKPSQTGKVQDKEDIRDGAETFKNDLKNWYFNQLDEWISNSI